MKCALCEREEKLMRSHLIPRFVYSRIRTFANSRFRKLDQFTKPLQDGEKYFMLCHDCEEKFSAMETAFVNSYFDGYLSSGQITKTDDMDNYVLSVAWRILHDDLFRLNSYSDSGLRDAFLSFEQDLRHYFNSLPNSTYAPDCFQNYVFTLDELGFQQDSTKPLNSFLFGYTYRDSSWPYLMVIVCYAGLVFVTSYENDRVMLIQDSNSVLDSILLMFFPRKALKKIVAQEVAREYQYYADEISKKMTPEIEKKIREYYSGKIKNTTILQNEVGNQGK